MGDYRIRKMRRRFLRPCSGLASFLLLTLPAWSVGGEVIEDIRFSSESGKARVVFDLSAPVEYRLFMLEAPERLVIDFADARFAVEPSDLDFSGSIVHNLRYAPRDVDDLRVVLDLNRSTAPRSFMLAPAYDAGHRLVIDLPQTQLVGSQPAEPRPILTAEDALSGLRDVVIAIDAGHGGKDPGAIGAHGTYEKDIVLAIARQLEALIAREPGMRPVMIRDADMYLSLRERIQKAREHKADLFISIHADAAYNQSARGSSVYVLSEDGASSEAAKWLAERENAADLVGGVSLSDKDELLASVLLDLSQSATGEASLDLADDLLTALMQVGDVHSERVHNAGFVVLKSPDIPSVLVESAFISNPAEEERLRTSAVQQSIAEALLQGIRDYFQNNAPPGAYLAESDFRRHVTRQGETLSAIADRYRVGVQELRTHNALESDMLSVGQVLQIPSGS